MDALKTKRAAPDRATRDTTTHTSNDNASRSRTQHVLHSIKAKIARWFAAAEPSYHAHLADAIIRAVVAEYAAAL
jgi:hypothetical protein